ncbi:MAG: 23S rRNA (adenine(2503)-C(2))-methyltransferase RlmN, partial [Firmicutes bacterium]|nr:23S rRNA (adenine(2503)-C(2))-methyltransferase RlmN [Bacillota bacterium]
AEYVSALRQPEFRAAQIFAWVLKGATVDEMTNVPKALRERIRVTWPEVLREQVSKTDGTRKLLVGFEDGEAAECVFMKYDYGNTACLSTQVGCRMGCRFCASGMDGLVRDLTAGEMLGELCALEKAAGEPVSHIVLMGTGEPMDNYENVARFLRIVHEPKGRNLSYRNVTLSTCGVIPGIERLGAEFPQVNLAISLHAATDEKRRELMPIDKRYPLGELLAACKKHAEATGRRVTFEYTLIRGENDSEADADRLAALLRGMLAHVNLIPLNKVKEKEYTGATREAAKKFAEQLERKGVPATVRRELGSDIDAACGQLRRRERTAL